MVELSGEYVLDRRRTRIRFAAAHRVGGAVRGRFDDFEGAVRLDPSQSVGWLTVRMASVDTGNRRRDAQLRTDFFDTTTYPTMTFVSTKVTPVDDRRYDVTGDLTIRGTTQSLTVPFELTDELHLTASHTINRHTWRANGNAFTTALVRPNITLDLDIYAIPTPPTHP